MNSTQTAMRPIAQAFPLRFVNQINKLGGVIAGGYAKQLLFPALQCIEIPRLLGADVDIFMRTNETEKYDIMFRYLDENFTFLYSVDDLCDIFQVDGGTTELHQSLFPRQIQLIKPTVRPNSGNNFAFGNEQSLIQGFDFSVCMAAIVYDDQEDVYKILCHIDTVDDNLLGELRINKFQRCPFGMVWRIQKYINKGYKLPAEEFLAIFENWDNAEPNVKNSLKDLTKEIQDKRDVGISDYARQYDQLYKLLRFD